AGVVCPGRGAARSAAPLIYRVPCQPLLIATSCSAVKAASRRLRRWPSASLDRLRSLPQPAAVINALGCHLRGRSRNLLFAERIAQSGVEPYENDHFARLAA